jgi:hypothetical protein|nr:MAG TPA: hypothetical protein [Caudoviricetes sp.]
MKRIYMTEQMRDAIRKIRLTEEEILQASNEIYDILRGDVATAERYRGRDYIIQVPERKVGKTYNLIKIAAETGYPVIVHNSAWGDNLKREAKKKYGWNIKVISYRSIPMFIDGMKSNVMLKDEKVNIVDVRDRLNDGGLNWVSVVGIN